MASHRLHQAGGLRFHDLRHSDTTWLVDDGVPPNMVQRVMGPERSSTTPDLYTRRTDNSSRILDALNDPTKYPTTSTRTAVRSPSTLRRDAMLREPARWRMRLHRRFGGAIGGQIPFAEPLRRRCIRRRPVDSRAARGQGTDGIDGELLLHRPVTSNGEDCRPVKVEASTIRGLPRGPTLTGVGPTGARCPCPRSARPRPGRCGVSAGPRGVPARGRNQRCRAHLPALTIARYRVEHPTQPALDATGVRVDGPLVLWRRFRLSADRARQHRWVGDGRGPGPDRQQRAVRGRRGRRGRR
jgi:hypothetical protein